MRSKEEMYSDEVQAKEDIFRPKDRDIKTVGVDKQSCAKKGKILAS